MQRISAVVVTVVTALLLSSCKPTSNGPWDFDEWKDKVTDVVRAVAVSKSAEGDKLMLLCKSSEDTLEMRIHSERWLGRSDGSVEFIHRADDKVALKFRWITVDRIAAATGTVPTQIVAYVGSAKQLIVRLEAYDGKTFNREFEVTGMTEIMEKVRNACRAARS